jgi:lipocalin
LLALTLTCLLLGVIVTLVLVFAPASALRVVGYVVGGLTGAALVGWGVTAAASWAHVSAELGSGFESVGISIEELQGTWDSVASSPGFRWESPDCDSTAHYEKRAGEKFVRVQNVCRNLATGLVSVADGRAWPTKQPGVLAVSFFPGAYGSFVVRAKAPGYLVVTDRESSVGWLLRKQGQQRASEAVESLIAQLESFVGPVQRRHDLRKVKTEGA